MALLQQWFENHQKSLIFEVSRQFSQIRKLSFIWLAQKDNLILLNCLNAIGINLNAKHVNGMTHFDLSLLSGKLLEMYGYLIR